MQIIKGMNDGDLEEVHAEIKAAMDKFIKENEPPEGFYSVSEYRESLYPELSSKKVSAILEKMVAAGAAIRSDKKCGEIKVWYYKIML